MFCFYLKAWNSHDKYAGCLRYSNGSWDVSPDWGKDGGYWTKKIYDLSKVLWKVLVNSSDYLQVEIVEDFEFVTQQWKYHAILWDPFRHCENVEWAHNKSNNNNYDMKIYYCHIHIWIHFLCIISDDVNKFPTNERIHYKCMYLIFMEHVCMLAQMKPIDFQHTA